ncbi:MAG: succinate dehydrogenase, hydrophobic membrane anchor protein [Steroidobacteraceae bacterium]
MTAAAPGGTRTERPDPQARRHWRNQRLSAIALLPLGGWFLYMLLTLPALDYAAVTAWISEPLQALLLLLFSWFALWHSALGVQVVIEDYVAGRLHAPTARLLQLMHWAAAIAAGWSIWMLAAGGT